MDKEKTPKLISSNVAKTALIHDAERELISIILNKVELQSIIISKINHHDFYFAEPKGIYSIIEKMYDNSENINYQTVLHKISNNSESQHLIKEMSEITSRYSGTNNYESLIKIIFSNSSVQKLHNIISDINNNIKTETDITKLISESQSKILELRISLTDEKLTSVEDSVKSVIRKINERTTEEGGLTGVNTGFNKLNSITSGFQKGDLIIIAARPSMGKTAFAINLAINASTSKNCIFFSLEMPEEQISQRILSLLTSVNLNIIRSGEKSQVDKHNKEFFAVSGKLQDYKLFIDDTPGLSLLEIQARLRKAKIEQDIQIAFIDYLQLISTNVYGDSRNYEIAKISQGLKQIARELDIPIVCLSQLSRSVEKREDKRPMMSDLRDSGAIEQDADIVTFLYRKSYYDKSEDDSVNNETDDTEFIISKNRNGETRTIIFNFSKENGRFQEKLEQ